MILGTGHDIVDTRRIERAIERHGQRFLNRVFTEGEQALAESRPGSRAATYARRFAAKEATLKALGTGLRGGLKWTDIEVINDENGKPSLSLHAMAQHNLLLLNKKVSIHLSLTDEFPYASAWVIIEAITDA